ncbi:MAG: winged helix-turn-helix domain-containing protein [Haloglomus sp.]
MSDASEDDDRTGLSPDEAFTALGHETRIRIIELLADADRAEMPLAFSELRSRADMRDSGQFNYHLDTLVGHFVERTDEGYALRRAGERVAEAILSSAVTDDPVLERTETDRACPYCGAPVEVRYREEQLAMYCTACSGTYDAPDRAPGEEGFLGFHELPPVGLEGRTPTEVQEAATQWTLSRQTLAASGMCPQCSATLAEWVGVCDAHADADGVCEACENRYAIQHYARCDNCPFARRLSFGQALLDDTALLSFLTDHGINPVSPSSELLSGVLLDYEETLLQREPFRAEFTFSVEGDAITLTVDADLDVVDATEHEAA